MAKETFLFDGFEPANTTPVPDILFDRLLTELSNAELRVLLYIIRRTWGFKKDTDAISLSQFTDGIITREGKVLDRGCGIKNRTIVCSALATLEKKGCIKSTKGDDPLGDKATNLYTIRFKGSTKSVLPGSIENVPPSTESVPPVVSKSHHRSNQTAPRVVSKTYPQETVLQDTVKQDTEEQERESTNTLDTHTIVSSDTAHADSLQDEEMFTNAPQGDTHATRVPTLPRANHLASLERDAAGHPQSDNHCAVSAANDIPVVHPVGSGTPGPQESQDGKDTSPLTPAQSLPLPQDAQAALGARTRTRKAATAPDKPEFLPEGEALYRDWCSLFHVTIPKTKAIILAANELYEPITFWAEQKLGITKAEVLKRIMNWLYKNNPNYYGEGRGVKLYDIHRDFEEWQSAAERKLAKDALKVVVPPAEDKSRMFNMTPIILESSRTKRQGGLRGKAVTATH